MAIRPVTSSGVSAANWVAAMLTPAFQPRRLRPARKYSSRLREACLRARSPEVMAAATKARTIRASSTDMEPIGYALKRWLL